MSGTDSTKQCIECGLRQPLSAFHKDKSKPDGHRPRCKACRNAAIKAARPKEREREDLERQGLRRCSDCEEIKPLSEFHFHGTRRNGKQYRRGECKGCRYLRDRTYAAENPDVNRQSCARYYENNRESRNASSRAWSKKNKERARENARRWSERNKDREAARRHRRRAWMSNGHWTLEQWNALLDFYDHTCLCCGEQGRMTFDHVIPLSRGGENTIANAQPLCLHCNFMKGVQETDYRDLPRFMEFLDSLVR